MCLSEFNLASTKDAEAFCNFVHERWFNVANTTDSMEQIQRDWPKLLPGKLFSACDQSAESTALASLSEFLARILNLAGRRGILGMSH